MKIKKFKNLLYFIIFLFVATFTVWYATNSLLLSLAFDILILIGMIRIKKLNTKKNKLIHDIDAAYNFVNLMNIQMLSTTSVYEAYKSIENYIDADFANIDSDDIHEQLNEVANNYNLNSFKMYVHTLQIYENEGGNFKKMQEIPTSLCQKCKIYYHKLEKNKFSKLIEISTLFILWILIIYILRISIPDYYEKMMENVLTQIGMFAIIATGGFLYYQAVKEYLINEIRGL